MIKTILLALVGVTIAFPSAKPTANGTITDMEGVGPRVTITNGTVIGRTAHGIDSFIGIPYAKPPVGNLRLRHPQTINKVFGNLTLPEVAAACVQMDMSLTDSTGVPAEAAKVMHGLSSNFTGLSSEDCLTITVQRPTGIDKSQKLPVLFWIHGGGWAIGATQWYDGTAIIRKSMEMGEPVVFVEANYRLNAFGFLPGQQVQEEGISNLGLRDQRKAMHWIAENIEAFGGDADKVTIWGESAGAASVFDHLLAYNGDHSYQGKPLFRGAIMNSGTAVRTLPVNSKKAQKVFDQVAVAAGCRSSEDNVLDCLRGVSLDVYRAAMNSIPNFMQTGSNDLAFLPRPDDSDDLFPESPEVAVARGAYARVPIIMGNQQDEATPFAVAQRSIINSTETLVDFFTNWLTGSNRDIVAGLVDTYPDNPSAGLPANTGSKWELYPQYKRNAAIQSDLTFIMGRRESLSYMAHRLPAWSYLATYMHDFPLLGTYHISDLATQFSLKINQAAANRLDAAYISFVHHLNPNGDLDNTKTWWPQWDKRGLKMANFSKDAVTVMRDDFRWTSYLFWKKHSTQLGQ